MARKPTPNPPANDPPSNDPPRRHDDCGGDCRAKPEPAKGAASAPQRRNCTFCGSPNAAYTWGFGSSLCAQHRTMLLPRTWNEDKSLLARFPEIKRRMDQWPCLD